MSADRFPPDDPREWLRLARGDAAMAHADLPQVPRELLAFHAQQAAEKALKAVLLHRQVAFPRTHDLDRLFDLLAQAGSAVPQPLRAAATLTEYAVQTRYPLPDAPVSHEELAQALAHADAVLAWADECVASAGEVGS